MGFDWKQVLGTNGIGLADAYDESASDALYEDRPRQVPGTLPGSPIDPGDEAIDLPIDEV